MSDREEASRRKWISLGEIIALAALIVSAVGVWISWKGSDDSKPTQVIERRSSVPLSLRGKAVDQGRTLEIAAVEPGQAIQSLKVTVAGAPPIDVGSDGELAAADVQSALKSHQDEPKDRRLSIPVRIDARFVDGGQVRSASLPYSLQYKWEGGGLFGGRSLHLLALAR